MSVEVSVIIPVYNVEKTLRRCVESILTQTMQDFEIVLVNDGSEDGSGKICDEYKERDNRIKVIHKYNEGLGPTRNAGFALAQGKYIYHCDSDDWIEKNMLEEMVKVAEENNVDMVILIT
jgi:glycosyltransferase involved in cell wall biosynthesis